MTAIGAMRTSVRHSARCLSGFGAIQTVGLPSRSFCCDKGAPFPCPPMELINIKAIRGQVGYSYHRKVLWLSKLRGDF
jgi:hypothetical protein